MADKNQILTDEQIGLGASRTAAPKTLSDSDVGFEPPARGFGGWARDVAATAVKGAIAVPEMVVGLADIPTGGRVGKFLENEGGAVGFRPKQAKEIVNEWHSDATKEAQRKFQQADGFVDKAVTAIQNPSNIFVSVGESIPSMLAGGVMGRGALATARGLGFAATPATTAVGALTEAGAATAARQATIAGAAGEGLSMAGSAAEQIRQETEDGLLTPMQSGDALLTGAVGGAISRLSGGLQNKLGIGDADTMAVQGLGKAASPGAAAAVNPLVQQAAARSIPNQIVLGAINEGLLEELPQSLAEQMLQNVALGKPWHQDLDAAAIMGTLSGGVMGAGAAGFNAYRNSGAPEAVDPGSLSPKNVADYTNLIDTGIKPELQQQYRELLATAQDESLHPRARADAAQALHATFAPDALPKKPATEALRAEYEARLADLQAQEQGEPPVRQTTPPSGRAVIEARRNAEMAAGRADLSPDDEIYQSTGATDPVRQMVQQAADAGGALSSAAVVAIDTGAAGQMQQAADQAQAQTLAQEQAKPGKKADPAAKVDASTGEIAGGAMANWTDDQLSSAFRGAQDRKVRIQLANELQRRRTEREQADLQAELQAEQAAMGMPDLPDNAFASVSEDAGEAPADLFIDEPATRSPATRKGNSNGTQAAQAQQAGAQPAQPAQPADPQAAGPAGAGRAGQGEAVGRPVRQSGQLTNAAPTSNNGAQAAPAPGTQAQAGGKTAAPAGAAVEALRTKLREVEDKILRAAPGAMAAGGGDIEAAMKSPKVPVTLKAQRKKLKDQMQAAQPAVESGDGIKLTPAQKREIEAGGTGFVGELGESARSSLQAMRNNPKVPVIPTNANGSYFNDELPQYTDIGSGFSVRGYSVRGDVVQDIKLPNGMVIQRKLKADGSVTGSAEGNYDQIVEGKGFAEAEKMVADYFAGRRPEAQTRALPAPKVEAADAPKSGYTLPDGDINDEWRDAKGRGTQHPDFEPTARQQILMDAVGKVLDAGAFYNDDVQAKLAGMLGVGKDVLASNRTGVVGGDFGYDVYLARRALETKRATKNSEKIAQELNLSVGDSIGTLIFLDFKVTTGVTITSKNDTGLIYGITGKRGAAVLNGEVGVDNIKGAIERAHERGKRKDSYADFIASRKAQEAAAQPAPKKSSRSVLAKLKEQARAEHFAPGNVIASYGGGHDRVVSYQPSDEQGNWSVTVRAVQKQGDTWVDVPNERERTHRTEPDAKELTRGPVGKVTTTDAGRNEAPVELTPTGMAERRAKRTGTHRFDYPQGSEDPAAGAEGEAKRKVVDYMNGDISRTELMQHLGQSGLERGVIVAITQRIGDDGPSNGEVDAMMDGRKAAPAEPSEIDHNGTRIYQSRIKLGDAEPKLMWAVESATNKAKRLAGERTVSGDTLHDTLEQAKKAAEREAKRDAAQAAGRSELDAQEAARKQAEEERKASNRGKSVLELRKEAVLEKQVRDSEKGDVLTRREWVQRKLSQGLEPKITQENKIKPMTRTQFNRASQAEQDAHERKIKQAGKKDVFWLGDFEVTKIEHDYAKELIAQRSEQKVGDFGPILTQYRGDAQGAIKALTELQDGEAVAALNHPEVGDIDLVWGSAPEGKREGFGLAKITEKHPEVLADLQGFISSLSKDAKRSGANRVRLVDGTGEAVVSLDWKGDSKVWLLTAYEKGAEAGTTMDTASNGSEGDTARPGPGAETSVPTSTGEDKGGSAQADAPKLTADQTTSQIRWQDMGTKDGVHTHSLFFYETQEAFEANQGRMAYGTITKGDVSASKWSVDGVEGMFEGLADAKKAAVAHALERLRRDGYVQDEPTQTAPASTPEARFEQERAKGGQNAGINAFAKIAGATGESVTDVWQRWRSVMAFDDKVEKGAGADVAKAMQEQLLKAPWANDAVYPGDGRSMSPAATLHQWRVREGKFAEQKESFSRELDREELRARDAENFGVPVEAVSQARKAVAAMRKRVIELEAEVKDGVAEAEAREEAAKTAEQKAYQDSFEMPSQSVLAKKPTPASIDNWSNPVEWRGKTVYTNGHFVDVTGTPPHLKDWESRKGVRQNLTTSATDRVLGMAGVRDGFPDNSHVKADPLAVIDDAKSGRLFFDVQGELVSIDLKYARYFQSKVKGATFTANPKDLGGPLRVMEGDNLVGIVMPFRPTIYDKSPKMTVADVRGYMASSGKDKPQSVVKRAQQAKEQEAKPAETPAEDAADVFPMQEAASSYSGISHSGTQRAKADAAEFEAYIERANAAGLALAETDEQKAAVEQATKSLRADYLAAYRRMMGVRAGTYSGFVAGRSGLNAKQADRRNSAYDRAIDEFVSWQKENDSRVRRAALDARTDEAKQADIDAARAADDQKAQAKEDADLTLMRKILNWKKGGEPVAIGKAANLNGVNLDKAGYPSSVKLSPTDGSTLTDDKFDLAALFRRKGMSVPESKRRVRELVDAVRAEDGAQVAAAQAEPAPKVEDSKTPTVDRHMEVMEGVRAGTATPEQFKASFNAVVDGKEAILAELDTKTKVELLRAGGAFLQMRYASERKSEVVEAFYRQLVGEYTLGEGVNYGMGKGSYEAAVRRMVEATDEAKLKSYLEERKAAVAEALARRAARVAAITNPQTLADFREVIGARISDGMSQQEAFLTLTPEQRIKYDTLAAESTRERREEIKRKAKTQVATAGNTSASEVIATKHTKLGHDLFVVKLADRVERDEYLTLNASAKRLGGSYSSFRGNGAIPGFQFRTREAAEAFRALVEGDTTQAQELAAQRRDAFEDDRSQTAVERLRAMAEKLEAQAEEEENRQRKTNTAKRARYASSALAGAAADKAKAKTMRNIADAIEAGNAKFLDEVRTKSQVDMLTAIVATAKSNELRAKYPSYADQEKRRGEPPTAETADFAEFPSYASFRSDLASLARQMLEVEGTKKLGQRLMSVADDVTDTYLEFAKKNISKVSQFGRGDAMADFSNKDDAERAIRRSGLTGKAIVLTVKRGQHRVILSPGEAIGRKIWEGDGDKRITLNGEFGAELVEAIGRRGNKQNSLTVPWQFQNAYDRRKALSRLGIETASEYRSAVREFIALKEQAVVNRTKELELQMVGRKADGLDFFPTSSEVADQMIEAADLSPDMAVLEPSAGMGHLADRIREAGAEPDVIEISPERRELLEEKGYHLSHYDDFLQMEPRKFFTYGDLFRAPDGKEGTMRGVGRMGSQRVRLEDENGNRLGLYDRDELTGIGHRGTWSGYDRIIMNPPFSNRRDAEHVMHAYTLLKPGGRIVAIMGEGVFFGQDKKAQEFRDWLESVGGTSEKLPAGSFMDPSLPVNTSVNARMVVIDKPAGDLVLPSRDDAGAGVNTFRTTRAPGSTQAQLSLDAVKKTVESALRRVVGAPTVQVVARPEDIGLGNPFTSVPKGVTLNDGSVVVFSDGAESVVDVYRTVFHELFHRGSKVRFERNSDYITKMLTIAAGDETVRAEVASWKKSDDGLAKMSEFRANGPLTGERLANYEAIAVEEALATMAERIGMGELTQPQGVIKRIARFLARVADAWGMTQLSHWLRNQSTSETEKFVMETIAMSGGKANTFSTALLFNTSQSADTQELADLFKALEAPRGLKLTQAYRAVDQHPLSSKIREVESNFLDILERLDDAGLVQINC